MDRERPPDTALSAAEVARVGELLDEVLRLVDDGELSSTAPERAHLAGSAATMKLYSSLAAPPGVDEA